MASVAFASERDGWDPTEAKGFEGAVRDVNRRVGQSIVDSETGRIPKSWVSSERPSFRTIGTDESVDDLVVPRQRDLSHAISSHEFRNALAHTDPRTRARWISETGEDASEWAFVLLSKKDGFAYTPTEFRTLVRWWLGENIYPGPRPCPMEKCTQPLGPEGDHTLSCKSGHGITSRHNALASQFSDECKKAGLAPKREVNLGNKGPGGTLTRPGDVFFTNSGLGHPLVLDFAVTHVQQQKYTDTVRDANWVTAGSFAEQYATTNKVKQREGAEVAKMKFAAMVVESYGSWSPSAMAVLRKVAADRAAYGGNTLLKGEVLHHLLISLNVTLMRSQARMLVLRLPAESPNAALLGYGKED